MSPADIKAWVVLGETYAKRADDTVDHALALAWLVLAEHCMYQWSGDRGGPTDPMVRLAEQLTGENGADSFQRERRLEVP